MSEDNGRAVVAVRGGSVLADPHGGVERDGKASGNVPLAEASTSGREASIPDPEVPAVPKRRRFSAAYKAHVVEEADGCRESGAVGALLRREGLYSSQLSAWRKLYHAGALRALRDDKRGRKATKHPLEDENARLRKHNERLSGRLDQAEAIIEIQKKVAAMLGIPRNSIENEEGE